MSMFDYKIQHSFHWIQRVKSFRASSQKREDTIEAKIGNSQRIVNSRWSLLLDLDSFSRSRNSSNPNFYWDDGCLPINGIMKTQLTGLVCRKVLFNLLYNEGHGWELLQTWHHLPDGHGHLQHRPHHHHRRLRRTSGIEKHARENSPLDVGGAPGRIHHVDHGSDLGREAQTSGLCLLRYRLVLTSCWPLGSPSPLLCSTLLQY